MSPNNTTPHPQVRDVFNEKISVWECGPWGDNLGQGKARHHEVTLSQFLAPISKGRYRPHVEMLRDLMSAAWDEQKAAEALPADSTDRLEHEKKRDALIEAYKKGKPNAPVAMLQGICPTHAKGGFTSMSNLLCIDIDGPKPGEPDNGNAWVHDWEALKRETIAKIKYIAYCALSVGGNGLFAIIPIAPLGLNDDETFAAYYEALSYLFKQQLNLTTDAACKNTNRMRFMSWDEHPHVNRDAWVWDKILQVPKDWRQPAKLAAACSLSETEKNRLAWVVNYAVTNGCLTAESYDNWMKICALVAHYWNNAEGRELAHRLASMSAKYKRRDTDRKIDSLAKSHAHPVTFNGFLWIAKAAGVPIPREWMPKAQGSFYFPPVAPAPSQTVTTATPPPVHAAQTVTTPPPVSIETPTAAPAPVFVPPSMSKSEETMLQRMGGKVKEGQAILARMRAENADLDRLCELFDLDYYWHGATELPMPGEWRMSKAQFFAQHQIL